MIEKDYPKYYGFFMDMESLNYEPIMDIDSNYLTKNNYLFLLQRTIEKDYKYRGNYTFIDTLLETNLQRKNLKQGGWQLSAQIKSNSRYTPDRLFAECIDPNNVRQKFWSDGADMHTIISLINKFEEIAKNHNSWLNYNLLEENERLRNELETIKSSNNFL